MAGEIKRQAGPHGFIMNEMALLSRQGKVLTVAYRGDEDTGATSELNEAKAHVTKLFAAFYHYELKWGEWNKELRPYSVLQAEDEQRRREKALALLESKSVPREIKAVFQGEWDERSAEYKEN